MIITLYFESYICKFKKYLHEQSFNKLSLRNGHLTETLQCTVNQESDGDLFYVTTS